MNPALEATQLATLMARTPIRCAQAWVAALAVIGVMALSPAQAQAPADPAAELVEETAPEPVIEAPGTTEQSAPEPAARTATPVVDPPGRVARLSVVEGEVSVAPAGTEEWAEAVVNRPLTSGDRVWIEGEGRAEMQIGSSVVYLDHATGFGFIELDDNVLQANLTEGAATVRVRRLAEGETIQVETPHATIVLDRVGEYHLEVDKDADRTIVKTRSGEAKVQGRAKTYTVKANEQGTFSGLEDLQASMKPIGPRTPFENWANDRDVREERSKSARYVSRDAIGYEDLDDNGEWIDEPEYGHVWRPLYVAYDWAPYRYGRWAWVGPWGWTWIDDARWGFTPFHYGRWAYVRSRWCWVPGPRHLRPIYSPALVGWVGGPSLSVSVGFGSGIGWYPLAPHDIFVPGYRHTPRYSRYVNVTNTIIVNNYYLYGGYGGRGWRPGWDRDRRDWDWRRHPHAITAVGHDAFVGGRSIGGSRMRVGDNDWRNWRNDDRPPALTPYRESVLAGQARRGPGRGDWSQGDRNRDRNRGNWNGGRGDRDLVAGRMPFHTERSGVEANGGRPLDRGQLMRRNSDGPKQIGDFNSLRPNSTAGGVKRSDLDRAQVIRGNSFSGGSNRGSNVIVGGNDSDQERNVREGRDGSFTRSFDSRRDGNRNDSRNDNGSRQQWQRDSSRDRERVEIMRAEEQQQSNDTRRRDHWVRPPANGFQQTPQQQMPQQREDRGGSNFDSGRRQNDGGNRNWGGSRERDSRDTWSRPQSQPRQQQQQSQPRSSGNRSSDGGKHSQGNNRGGGSRPWSTSKQ